MTTWIRLALLVGVVLTVFALGLRTGWRDGAYLFQHPVKLARALLAMYIVMPLLTAILLVSLRLHPAVNVALMALAVSPIPPLLPARALKAGGHAPYTISLLFAAAALSIVFVPLAVVALGRMFGREAPVSVGAVALIVLITVLAPLSVGMVVRRAARDFAERAAQPVAVVALVVLAASAIPLLWALAPTVGSLVGNGTLAALATFVVVGIIVGHLLGGPNPENRTALALTTSSRHPGVALTIAAPFSEQKLVAAVLVCYLVVNFVVSLPYRLWSKRRHDKSAHALAT